MPLTYVRLAYLDLGTLFRHTHATDYSLEAAACSAIKNSGVRPTSGSWSPPWSSGVILCLWRSILSDSETRARAEVPLLMTSLFQLLAVLATVTFVSHSIPSPPTLVHVLVLLIQPCSRGVCSAALRSDGFFLISALRPPSSRVAFLALRWLI